MQDNPLQKNALEKRETVKISLETQKCYIASVFISCLLTQQLYSCLVILVY